MITKRKQLAKTSKGKSSNSVSLPAKQPFKEHFHKLSRGLFVGVASVGLFFVRFSKRKQRRNSKIQMLTDQDASVRAKREAQLAHALSIPVPVSTLETTPKLAKDVMGPAAARLVKPVAPHTQQLRSQKYVNSFIDFRPAQRTIDIA
jgi:hypothetical protein